MPIEIAVFIIIISLCFFGYGIYSLRQAHKLKIQKIEYDYKCDKYTDEITNLQLTIAKLKDHKIKLLQEIEDEKSNIDATYEKERKHIQEQIDLYKANTSYASEQYLATLEKDYYRIEQEYDKKIAQIKEEKKIADAALKKLKDALTAGIQAQLREQEMEQKKDFYTLQIDKKNLYEINVIKSIENQLSDPRPLRMLIWTTYYSKKANELCSRILGKTTITGIYKITNLNTNQCYIGQAKDCRERWREHMKCGLGIDTPTGNKLYQAMIKDGLNSFTFELLEQCSAIELNEKEKFFIDLYSSYDYGYNGTRGNK